LRVHDIDAASTMRTRRNPETQSDPRTEAADTVAA
jgi:hypothetical protein